MSAVVADRGTVQALTSLAMAPKPRLNLRPARGEQVDIRGVEIGCVQPVADNDKNKVPRGQRVAFYLFKNVAEFLANQGGVLSGVPAQGPPKEM